LPHLSLPSSSWPMHQHDIQRSGRNPNPVTSRIFYDSSRPAPPECCDDYVEYNDIVYMPSNLIREQKGILFAMNRTSNSVLWKFGLNQANSGCFSWTYSTPVIDTDGEALYATGDCITPFSVFNIHPCVMVKISARNGTLMAKEERLMNGSCSDISLTQNSIWVQNEVDVNTTIIWSFSKDFSKILFHHVIKKNDKSNVHMYANGQDIVYVSYKNVLKALHINGSEAWSYTLPNTTQFIGGFASSNDLEIIYTVTRNFDFTSLHTFFAKLGKEIWNYPYLEKTYGDGLAPAIGQDDMIYWSTGKELLALSPIGGLEWYYRSPKSNVNYVSPILTYNDIVILSFGNPGGIVGIDRFYGKIYWAYWDENPSYEWRTPFVDANKRIWVWATGVLSTPLRYCYEEKGINYPLCLMTPSEL